MKATLLFALTVASSLAIADDLHQGYVKKDGTYVAPHYQTAPDSTRMNNYSTQGNANPYTGQAGTHNPYQQQQPTYQQQNNNSSSYGQQPRQKNGW